MQGCKSASEPVIFTLLEKKTRYYLALKVLGKTADSIQMMMHRLYQESGEQFRRVFKTITADNGPEFAELSQTESLGSRVYFAHPYAASERGRNERHNRILRRFIPKGKFIRLFSENEVLLISNSMNGTPKRILNYQTPEELFDQQLDEIYALS